MRRAHPPRASPRARGARGEGRWAKARRAGAAARTPPLRHAPRRFSRRYIAAQNERFEKSISEAANAVADAGFEVANSDDNVRGDLSIEEETHLGELVRDLAKQVEVERESLHATEERIAVYRKSFDELKSVSGHSELTDVVQVYVKSEEETFSLFNYIQALNQETDWTLERHARLEEEIKKYEERLGEEEAQRAEAMADLQEKWRNAKEATEECSQAALEAQRTLDRIAKKIQSLFFKIQCDQVTDKGKPSKGGGGAGGAAGKGSADSRLAALGGQGVSESNILAYTELIEQRALEIIADYTKRMNTHWQRQMTPMLDVCRSRCSRTCPARRERPGQAARRAGRRRGERRRERRQVADLARGDATAHCRRRPHERRLLGRPAAASNPHAHKRPRRRIQRRPGGSDTPPSRPRRRGAARAHKGGRARTADREQAPRSRSSEVQQIHLKRRPRYHSMISPSPPPALPPPWPPSRSRQGAAILTWRFHFRS